MELDGLQWKWDDLKRSIESLSWKGPIRPSSPTPAQGRNPNQSRSDRRWSNFLLKASSVGALTTSQVDWFHCPTALTAKKFFRIFRLKLNAKCAFPYNLRREQCPPTTSQYYSHCSCCTIGSKVFEILSILKLCGHKNSCEIHLPVALAGPWPSIMGKVN